MKKLALVVGLLVFTMGVAQAATLLTEDFQSPILGNGTANPGFAGWTYDNGGSVKSRINPGQGDFPTGGVVPNQGVQLEWTSAKANYTVSAPTWSSGDVFTLTMDVAPQSWNGTQDRYIRPSLSQGGSEVWSANDLMAHYSGSPTWEQKQWYIPTTAFASGTDVKLQVAHTGFRGIYFDNIQLDVGAPPADNDPPTPDPATWAITPTVSDGQNISMAATTASDPNDVEYLFENLTTGDSTGWQDEDTWTQLDLAPDKDYSYRVKSRDKSTNQNETDWSATETIRTDPSVAGRIFCSSFQDPLYGNGTQNPSFAGWTYVNGNNVRARRAGSDGAPGDTDIPNQLLQQEWTNALARRDTSYGWSADDIFILEFNASPQAWNGSQDRFVEPKLMQTDGTVLWQTTTELPKYLTSYNGTSGGGWVDEQTFRYKIKASDFTTGTVGSDIRVQIGHSGFRGFYFDNVCLSTALPEPATVALLGLGILGLVIRRK